MHFIQVSWQVYQSTEGPLTITLQSTADSIKQKTENKTNKKPTSKLKRSLAPKNVSWRKKKNTTVL